MPEADAGRVAAEESAQSCGQLGSAPLRLSEQCYRRVFDWPVLLVTVALGPLCLHSVACECDFQAVEPHPRVRREGGDGETSCLDSVLKQVCQDKSPSVTQSAAYAITRPHMLLGFAASKKKTRRPDHTLQRPGKAGEDGAESENMAE